MNVWKETFACSVFTCYQGCALTHWMLKLEHTGINTVVPDALAMHIARASMTMVLNIQNKPGGRLNKKDGLTRYGDSHVKDKTS